MSSGSVKSYIKRRYGGRYGFLKYWQSAVADILGRYRAYDDVAWKDVKRLVFVCRGNICRSAFAEAFARQMGLRASSLGLATRSGKPANPAAIEQARCRGIALDSHRTTPVDDFRFERGDLALCMEPDQAKTLLARQSGAVAQVSLLGLWSQERRPYLHDPYGLDADYWETCFSHIESALVTIAKHLEETS